MLIYPIGVSDSSVEAVRILRGRNIPIIDHPSPDVTHLLLDIPSMSNELLLKNGYNLETVLSMLPPHVRILGGNLPFLQSEQHTVTDFLKDPLYLTQNAAITADCAIRLSGSLLNKSFGDTHILIIGYGRIGKFLAHFLMATGATITIAARNPHDRAVAITLGLNAISIDQLEQTIASYDLLFNTVPHPVLNCPIPSRCIALELASSPGIPAENAINARGLPGKYAPLSSGKLIANTVIRFLQEEIV